jgi:hypothetical protein
MSNPFHVIIIYTKVLKESWIQTEKGLDEYIFFLHKKNQEYIDEQLKTRLFCLSLFSITTTIDTK